LIRRKDNWINIMNHIDNMKIDFLIYIENKIKLSI
jgi:hypothetical protein